MGKLNGITRLTLTFGSLSVDITDLQRGGYSQTAISGQFHTVSQTLNNNSVIASVRGENKLQWDLIFWATDDTVMAIKEVALLSKLSPTPSMELVDIVTKVIDTPTLTRLPAPSPNGDVTTRASGYKSYYARFNVVITGFSPNEKIVGYDCANKPLWEVSLQLTEGDKTV